LLQMKKWLGQDLLRIEGGPINSYSYILAEDTAGDPVCYCGHKIPRPLHHSAVCISFCKDYKALSKGQETLT
jgi:hypothetical protein